VFYNLEFHPHKLFILSRRPHSPNNFPEEQVSLLSYSNELPGFGYHVSG
jgi:hypothetical protein